MKRDLKGIASLIVFIAVSIAAIVLISQKLDKKYKLCSGDFVFDVPSDFKAIKTDDLTAVFETDIENCTLTVAADPDMHCMLEAECATMSSEQLADGCTVKSEGYGITAGTDSYSLRVLKRSGSENTVLFTDVLLFGDGVGLKLTAEVPEAKSQLLQQRLDKIYSTIVYHGPALRDSYETFDGKYIELDISPELSFRKTDGSELRCAKAADSVELRLAVSTTKQGSYARLNIYSVEDNTSLEYMSALFKELQSDPGVKTLLSDTTYIKDRPGSHINYKCAEGDCTSFDIYAIDDGGVCYVLVYSFPRDEHTENDFRAATAQLVGGMRMKQ